MSVVSNYFEIFFRVYLSIMHSSIAVVIGVVESMTALLVPRSKFSLLIDRCFTYI